MSSCAYFVSNGISGFVAPDFTRLPIKGFSGKTFCVSSNSASGPVFSVKLVSLGWNSKSKNPSCVVYASNSGNSRRNPDFSRANRNGFSRNWNKPNGEKEDFQESESRNGPLLAFSGSKKSPPTAAPGPREKEIVELFRRVQAQLRERAAVKEEKKVEEPQVKGKESEHVDSLLRLLRKHSVQQSKRDDAAVTVNEDFIQEDTKPLPTQTEEPGANILDSNSDLKLENQGPHHSRPKSNFQKRSPVPQTKVQFHQPPAQSSVSTENNIEKMGLVVEHDDESDPESDVDPLFSGETSEDESSEIYESQEDSVPVPSQQMNGMKLTELRALAKSRGLKGFSKLKKSELIELLSE